MKENYLVNTTIKDDFNVVGMYFLEHNLSKNKYVNEENLLSYISSIIEAVTIENCINDTNNEYTKYLKAKNKEIIWLATKSRFRAKSHLDP
jgi:hypothetical protein